MEKKLSDVVYDSLVVNWKDIYKNRLVAPFRELDNERQLRRIGKNKTFLSVSFFKL